MKCVVNVPIKAATVARKSKTITSHFIKIHPAEQPFFFE